MIDFPHPAAGHKVPGENLFQMLRFIALSCVISTAFLETTAGFWIYWRGNFTLQNYPLFFVMNIDGGYRGDECLRVRV